MKLKYTFIIFIIEVMHLVVHAAPVSVPVDDELRHRRRRPCRKDLPVMDQSEDSRTLLILPLLFSDTYNNYDYNYNCGGLGNYGTHGGGGHGGHGGHGGGSHGGFGGGNYGGPGGPFNDPQQGSQSGNRPGFFDNGGALSNFFNSWFGPNRPFAPYADSVQSAAEDAIKPVVEAGEAITDAAANWRPGQVVGAVSMAVNGFTQASPTVQPEKVVRQLNRQINRYFRPFYGFFF